MKFTLTARLRKYATEKLKVKAGASDAEIKRAVGAALLGGSLHVATLKTLTGAAPDDKKGKKKSGSGTGTATLDADEIARIARRAVRKEQARAGRKGTGISPSFVFNKGAQVRVKEAAESYDGSTKAAIYPEFSGKSGNGTPHLLAGMPAEYNGRPLMVPSERDKAISGAYIKFCVNRQLPGDQLPRGMKMTDHDRELLMYALHNEKWVGMLGGDGSEFGATKVKRAKLNELQIKALLDDTISGGIEIAPVVFDDAIILTPVLYGELFPFVNTKPISRGRRIKGASLSLPQFTSGTVEGSAITPFNTAAFISAFDTGIYNASLAAQFGLDFEEDTPVDIGSQFTESAGLQAMAWLDKMIAIGNGTNEPTGIFTATGTVSVGSDNGAGGPPTVSDYEGLAFGISKQYRTEPGAFPVYVANDTTYRRARGIAVGPGDERRVFGMDHQSYNLMDRPFKVQADIPNNKVAFVNLRRYRMYRRLGMNVRVEAGGMQLALTNTRLLVIRMRWGGQLETGNACAVMTDAQLNG